jgi:hypothetical protein
VGASPHSYRLVLRANNHVELCEATFALCCCCSFDCPVRRGVWSSFLEMCEAGEVTLTAEGLVRWHKKGEQSDKEKAAACTPATFDSFVATALMNLGGCDHHGM